MIFRQLFDYPSILSVVIFFSFALQPSGAVGQTGFVNSDGSPIKLGVAPRDRNKADLCLDYGATHLRNGRPYRVVEPARTITQHEGMDFCTRAGSPVLAPLDGRIRFIEQDNDVYGGVVAITSEFSIRSRPNARNQRVFVEMVHVVPVAGLRVGQRVTAGQVVGQVQRANRPSIGIVPHVHFAVRRCNDWPTCHIDPNFFWRDGPGRVSCYDPALPVPRGRIVAPVPC